MMVVLVGFPGHACSAHGVVVLAVGMAMALLVLCSTAPGAHAFYGTASEVIDLNKVSYVSKIEKSNYLWVVEIYRTGCGYCQQLKPHYEKLAQKLRKTVRVAAVDAERSVEVARALEQKYNFQLKGVPTIFLLKPQADGKKKFIAYDGARDVNHMYNFALPHMPDYTQYVTSASLSKFRRKSALPAAVLVTNKKSTPPIWKGLSAKYKGKMNLGFTNPSHTELMEELGLTSEDVPAVVVVRSLDENAITPVRHTGPSTFISIDFFLMGHVKHKTAREQDASSESSPARNDAEKSAANEENPEGRQQDATRAGEKIDDAADGGASSQSSQSASPRKDRGEQRRAEAEDKKPVKPKRTEKAKEKSSKAKPDGKKRSKKAEHSTASPPSTKTAKHVHKGDLLGVDIPEDLEKLRISELREILADLDDPCSGCVEKKHMIERINKYKALQLQAKKRESRSSTPCQKQTAKLQRRIKRLEERLRDSEEEKAVLQDLVEQYRQNAHFSSQAASCDASSSSERRAPSVASASSSTIDENTNVNRYRQRHLTIDPLIEEIEGVHGDALELTVNGHGIAQSSSEDIDVSDDGYDFGEDAYYHIDDEEER